MIIGPDSVLRGRQSLASVEIDDEIVLYDDADRRLHRLNAAAATVWRCLDGTGTLAEISRDIADVYGTPLEDVLAGVMDTARHLSAEGLLAD